MHTIYLISLFVFGYLLQTPTNEDVKKEIVNNLNYITKKQYIESIEYTYPKLLDYIPKDNLLKIAKASAANKNVILSYDSIEYANISKPQLYKNEIFWNIDLSYNLIYTVINNDRTIEERENEPSIVNLSPSEIVYETLAKVYKKTDLRHHLNTVTLKNSNGYVVVYNKKEKKYYLMEKNPLLVDLYKKILPKEVSEKFW